MAGIMGDHQGSAGQKLQDSYGGYTPHTLLKTDASASQSPAKLNHLNSEPNQKHYASSRSFITSASPEVVWSILADVEHWCDWTPRVTEIKALNGTELKVGAQYRVVQPKLQPATYEVTEYVPNRRFTWVQRFAGCALIADRRIAPGDGATKVELSFLS